MNTAKPIHKSNFTIKEVGSEILLYSTEAKAVHVLNPTAKCIWELCDGQHTMSEMEQTLRSRFSIADDQDVISDIRETLETFASKGLLLEMA